MTPLTREECTAGISRRALESFQADKHPPTNGTSPIVQHLVKQFRLHQVLDTPMRKLELLEKLDDGKCILRDTDYYGEKAEVRQIHLEYAEAHALAHVLLALEAAADSPDDSQQTKTKPMQRARAGKA